ncbi:N-acetyltransferase family protein [Rhizobium sp. YIM 134829]|uniref:GNAT family N-acetyltransferase n=1 Tax=Rhizobium sp. YIM 134829 TaxID=3390453 RepID=UPI003978AABD
MTATSSPLRLRRATAADAPTILRFVRELADYERARHEVQATEDTIRQSIFGEGSITKALICERVETSEPIGFAVWFMSYSTWQARNGLYLEDLYVTPEARGAGAGRLMLRELARIAVAEGCGRFEWSVLDWNAPAIRGYEAIGAKPQSEWIRYRLDGQALKDFAAG